MLAPGRRPRPTEPADPKNRRLGEKAKTWDHVSLAYVFTGRRSTSLEQKEQGGRGSMNPEVE